jgi:hypothetical protein
MTALPAMNPAVNPAVRAWTTPADVTNLLRKRWDTGVFLASVATGEPWQAVEVPLRGPTATELAQRFAEAQDWARLWHCADHNLLRVEYRSVGGRFTGVNQVPVRVSVDSFEQLCRLLGTTRQAARFSRLMEETQAAEPSLVNWAAAHPMRVLKHEQDWTRILRTVGWLVDDRHLGLYLRQITVPGVDTKFIEQHRGLLSDLLDAHPRGGPADSDRPRAEFAGRYGFREKPDYVRFRLLDERYYAGLAGFTELTVRAEQFGSPPAGVRTVYVMENEITYLAFPHTPDSIVVFGSGYRVGGSLERLTWLSSVELVYWGDIDTHGFAILNRLRHRFPQARSILMDQATLLAHKDQWVREPSPTSARLDRLSEEESELYAQLVSDQFGPAVRLEQERIQYTAIEAALR